MNEKSSDWCGAKTRGPVLRAMARFPRRSSSTRKEVLAVQVSATVEKYMVAIIAATLRPADFESSKLAQWIKIGASPRGTLALDRAGRAHAWLEGRDTATPDDVKAVAHACLRHRLILSYEAEAEGITKDNVLDELLKLVAVP
jgi:MoxR-like ATPase